MVLGHPPPFDYSTLKKDDCGVDLSSNVPDIIVYSHSKVVITYKGSLKMLSNPDCISKYQQSLQDAQRRMRYTHYFGRWWKMVSLVMPIVGVTATGIQKK